MARIGHMDDHDKMVAAEKDAKIETLKQHILNKSKVVSDADKTEVKYLLDQLVDESHKLAGPTIVAHAPPAKKSNPAVIGLASFAITATLFQFHNFGWMGHSPVYFLGIMLGGLVQLFGGLLEFVTGNNFGFAIFTTFGAFWVTLVVIKITNDYTIYKTTETDMGYFMLVFLIFTGILLAASLRHSTILPLLILTLFLGIALLMGFHFDNGMKWMKTAGAVMLLVNSIMAYYFLAALLMEDGFKRKILPVGKPVTEYFSRGAPRGFERGQVTA